MGKIITQIIKLLTSEKKSLWKELYR